MIPPFFCSGSPEFVRELPTAISRHRKNVVCPHYYIITHYYRYTHIQGVFLFTKRYTFLPLLSSFIKMTPISHKEVTHIPINNKDVFIVEHHNFASIAWHWYRQNSDSTPDLLTFDHHTDTKVAFTWQICNWCKTQNKSLLIKNASIARVRNLILSKMNDSQKCFDDAVQLLKHDEHIDFSICKKTIGTAFVIANEATTIASEDFKQWKSLPQSNLRQAILDGYDLKKLPPATPKPKDNIYKKPENCIIEIQNSAKKEIFSDRNLNKQLSFIEKIRKSYLGEKYEDIKNNFILDLDLDYIQYEKSLHPSKKDTFYDLIRSAKIITIAKEKTCFDFLNKNPRKMKYVDFALSKITEHITLATGNNRTISSSWKVRL